MAKEFKYKGKTLAELREMSIEDFAKLVTSRKRRTLLRGKYKPLEKRINEVISAGAQEKTKSKPIRTHRRDTVITPKMVGLTLAVHNGKEFVRVDVQPEMMGHVIGEFSHTRKRVTHGKAGIGATKSSTAIQARG